MFYGKVAHNNPVMSKTATQTRINAEDLKPGMVILPPAREISLWIKRHLAEKGLPEESMYLTIVSVREGYADKKGRWILVKCDHTDEWNAGRMGYTTTFKARPETLWPVVE